MLFENYSLSSSTLSSKNNRKNSKKWTQNKYVCLDEVIWLMTMKMRLKMENRSYRYDINRSRWSHGHKYSKYKLCRSIMVLYIKQHLSYIFLCIYIYVCSLLSFKGKGEKCILWHFIFTDEFIIGFYCGILISHFGMQTFFRDI